MVARPRSHEFEPEGSETVSILFVGDLMCMGNDRVPDIDPRLRALVSSADLVIGNCEAPVTRSSARPDASYLFAFEMAEEYLRTFLERLGVRRGRCVLSVANNHIGDQGRQGLEATLRRLRSLGVTPVGHRTRDGPIVSVRVGAVGVTVAAWTNWMNQDVFDAGEGVWRTDQIAQIPERAWAERKENLATDCLIGSPHWDYEFRHFPASETRALARRLMGDGFDLLVGHHPHVVQPIEWLDGGICLYSVANLNGPTSLLVSWPSRLLGVFEVRLMAAGRFRGRVAGYTMHPFVQLGRKRDVSIVPLDGAPRRLRLKLEERLRLVYPPTRSGTSSVPGPGGWSRR